MSKWGEIDILLNNAGIVQIGVLEDISLKDIKEEFEVNLFSYIGYMQLVCPIMRKQKKGRVINMGSISGRIAPPGLGFYAASKSALASVSDSARIEYKPFGVNVILIEPGVISTELWEKTIRYSVNKESLNSSAFSNIYSRLYKRAIEVCSDKGHNLEKVVRAVCHAATSKKPKARYCIPLTARVTGMLSYLPPHARDFLIEKFYK